MPQTYKGLIAIGTALALWCAILLCLEIGRRVGIAHLHAWGPQVVSGAGAINGAIFGLMGLLLGFAFNGAANRFDRRRDLVAEAANSVGTAWQRVDLLPADQQTELRTLFPQYLEALLASYIARPGMDLVRQPASVTHFQNAIWARAAAACMTPEGEGVRMLLLPSLSQMFGAVDRERMMRRIHPPLLIFIMLCVTELASGLFAGYSLASAPTRNWLYLVGFATAVALTTVVIIDLEFPRLGFVQIRAMDQELVDLHDAFSAHGAGADGHTTNGDERT